MDLIIIRHGRPVRHEVDEGSADPELSATGVEQAERTAALLHDHGVDHIVSSTMRRAYETAQPLAELMGVDVERIDDLKESDHGSVAYVPAEEMTDDDPIVHAFREDPMSIFTEGIDAFRARVVPAFDALIDTHRSKSVAVFCHGMVTTIYLQSLLGFDDVFALTPDYCGITRVQASTKGHRTVRSVNETAHVRHLLE